MISISKLRLRLLPLAAAALLAALGAAAAAEPVIPDFWDDKERLPRPDLSAVERVRFLTTVDFPPFNFIDGRGRLTGFHVDLARAICEVLDLTQRCQIQALPWDELDKALAGGEGEALIAGVAVTGEAREKYAFTRPYLRFPARFVTRKGEQALGGPVHASIAGKRIGVLGGSGHEAMLRAYFPKARPVTYSKSSWMLDDLREGRLAGIFGDGMRLSFWLGGEASAGCCAFVGGPFLAPEFLGEGLAIAVPREDAVLAEAFDYALREISVNGTFAELYLRYFPISFY